MAKRVKAIANPALIAWARTSAGFLLVDAAKRLKIAEGKLAAWEGTEGDSPSIPQLRKLAALYKRPLAVFFLAEVPQGFAVMRDLRRLPGSGTRTISPALQLEIRAANERRELAIELASELDVQLPKFGLSAALTEDPEALGARIRSSLEVSIEQQERWQDVDGRAGFNSWRYRIENTGVLVFQATQVPSEEASGVAIFADLLPTIIVNRQDALNRRTFSLLHEFAHLMVRVSGVSDLETDATRPPEDQKIEVFCNQVAAAALIPKEALLDDPRVQKESARSTNWSDELIGDLARRFSVSREALLRRLLFFGRTTNDFYLLKRKQYLEEYLKYRERQKEKLADKDIKRNMPQETISTFGRPLVEIVLENYHQNRITLSEVSGYLGLKTKHVPKLEQLIGSG